MISAHRMSAWLLLYMRLKKNKRVVISEDHHRHRTRAHIYLKVLEWPQQGKASIELLLSHRGVAHLPPQVGDRGFAKITLSKVQG